MSIYRSSHLKLVQPEGPRRSNVIILRHRSDVLNLEQIALIEDEGIARWALLLLQSSNIKNKSYSIDYLKRMLNVFSRDRRFIGIKYYQSRDLYSAIESLRKSGFVFMYAPKKDPRRWLAKRKIRIGLIEDYYPTTKSGSEVIRIIRTYISQ